jgi:hypothetical protein
VRVYVFAASSSLVGDVLPLAFLPPTRESGWVQGQIIKYEIAFRRPEQPRDAEEITRSLAGTKARKSKQPFTIFRFDISRDKQTS